MNISLIPQRKGCSRWTHFYRMCLFWLAYSALGIVLGLLIGVNLPLVVFVLPIMIVYYLIVGFDAFGVGLRVRLGLGPWPRIPVLRWSDLRKTEEGLIAREIYALAGLLSNSLTWKTLGWGVLNFISAVLAAVVGLIWMLTTIVGPGMPLWKHLFPENVNLGTLTIGSHTIDGSWAWGAAGLVTLLTMYPVYLGLIALLSLPTKIVFYPGNTEEILRRQAEQAAAERERAKSQRDMAIRSESESLRDLERNLHDGPQQSLVRTTLDIGLARRRLQNNDIDGALSSLDDATSHANRSLAELRLLVRGFGPSALTERGLARALEELAETSMIPATVEVVGEVDVDDLPARSLYFAASESLANANKYSGADAITITLEPSSYGGWELRVHDNGSGGAQIKRDHGLAGLATRLAAHGGTLRVDSTVGSGTTITAWLPSSPDQNLEE